VCTTTCFAWWSRLLADDGRPGSQSPSALSRRAFLATAVAPVLAAGCATVAPTPSGTTWALLESALSMDLHAHPALFPSLASNTFEGHCQRAAGGGVKLISLAAVADSPLLSRTPSGGLHATREPSPGELFASTWRQLDVLVARSGAAGMSLVRRADELGIPTTIPVRGLLAVEGCDFLEGRVDRIAHAHERGVRSLQLVHYRVNELGDIQTEPPRHHGLTPFGREAVREMNRLGIVVDVAHATFDVVKGAVESTSRPLILSHSNIQDGSGWARFITAEHARLVAETGGVIGAMPIILRRRGDDIDGYVNYISRLVDVVGIDHVGIGTDMDGIGPGAIFTSYARWPSLAAALLDRGYRADDVAKILGGNFQRVLQAVAA